MCSVLRGARYGLPAHRVDASFHVEPIASEIESHFERLLDRGNLTVRVRGDDELAVDRLCQPVDYAALCPGASVRKSVDLGGGQEAECNLCVLPTATALQSEQSITPGEQRSARFFASGRRIKSCGSTPSFAQQSENRWTIWSHPQVVGFIDVRGSRSGPLQPVITRDEFKNTRGRTKAYAAIIDACEGALLEAIEEANAQQSESSLSKLEDTLTSCLARVAEGERAEAEEQDRLRKLEDRKRRAALRAEKAAAAQAAEEERQRAEEEAARSIGEKAAASLGMLMENVLTQVTETGAQRADAKAKAAAEEEEARRVAEEKKKKARRTKRLAPPLEEFSVRLVRGFGTPVPEGEGMAADSAPRDRSRLVGSTIMVDSTHPDFQSRFRVSRQGAPKVDERLCGYLAMIVSGHYRERAFQIAGRQRVDTAQAYDDMISTYCRLEENLRSVLPALLREMADY